MAGAAVSRPPRVLHSNDARVAGDGAGYDYDLAVIGGGSGGLACSKAAAELGAKVVVLDFVKPSWQGTTWGLGGTCVNVGCIPKKLMHTAALLGEHLGDAAKYGWAVDRASVKHDWPTMVSSVQDHISSLNFGYRVSLRDKGVEYKNALGSFVDAHTLLCTDKKGKETRITARRFVIAVGGRPRPLDIPGGELALSSDDIFSLEAAPGKTLVIGASYVALECAGFLTGVGMDVTVMVRSILLRGFDQQVADMIGEHMESHGTKFIKTSTPTAIERTEAGKLKVTYLNAATGATASEEFDSVFVATGRNADTRKLNLAAASVVADKDGKIPCVAEQTSAPHVYAIGDVVSGKPELTPVAIMAGRLLARRLYGGATEGMDYEKIPTTVFTPMEYGCCGLSEEDANARFGAENVEVYHTTFTPLEWTIVEERPHNKCYAKLIVHARDEERVVGFHVLGPNAGEITQGWAAALRLGATYKTFTSTVGIHPTVSVELTGLTCVLLASAAGMMLPLYVRRFELRLCGCSFAPVALVIFVSRVAFAGRAAGAHACPRRRPHDTLQHHQAERRQVRQGGVLRLSPLGSR
jgi:thioredoxin reductase (NADPH)